MKSGKSWKSVTFLSPERENTEKKDNLLFSPSVARSFLLSGKENKHLDINTPKSMMNNELYKCFYHAVCHPRYKSQDGNDFQSSRVHATLYVGRSVRYHFDF